MAGKSERDTAGIVVAAVFVLLGALFLYESRDLMDPDSYVFPSAICTVMIVLSLSFIVFNLVKPQPDPEATTASGSILRRVGLVAVMLASAIIMPVTGFLLAGLGVFAALTAIAMFEPWTVKLAALYGVVGVAIVSGFYVLFAKIFMVPLPETPFL